MESINSELNQQDGSISRYACSLKEVFESYTKKECAEIARDKGLRGISNCNKDKLIDKLVAHMLSADEMERYFLHQADRDIEAFESALSSNYVYDKGKKSIAENLYLVSYVAMWSDGTFVVPQDVAEQYTKISTIDFHRRRKKISYLLCCLRTAGILYGITPMWVMMDMLKTNPDLHITEEEVRDLIEDIPFEYAEYVCVGKWIYHKSLYPDNRGLLSAQGDKDYYIPNQDEIMDIGELGYLPNREMLRKFIYFLTYKIGVCEQVAEFVGMQIQCVICGDCEMQDVFDILLEEGIVPQNEKELNKLVALIHEVWNDTRMLMNRGFTPDEMRKAIVQSALVSSDSDKIVSFESARKNKIYPNAPCPCGSGKKYKNCCKGKLRD